MKRLHFTNFDLAGFIYWGGVETFDKLKIGLQLRFERELNNKYAPKAVAIYFEEYKLGYVSRANNSEIAKLCEQGYSHIFDARINRNSTDEHTENQIGVVVHIINNSEFQNK